MVVLTGVGSDIAEDGQLVDGWVVFGAGAFEFRMKGFIAGAGETNMPAPMLRSSY